MTTTSEPAGRTDNAHQEAVEEARRMAASLSDAERQQLQEDLEAGYRWASEIVAGKRDPLNGYVTM